MLDRAFHVSEAIGAVALHVSWRSRDFLRGAGDRNSKVVAAA